MLKYIYRRYARSLQRMMPAASVRLNGIGVALICGVSLIVLLYFLGLPTFGSKEVNLKYLLSAGIQVARHGGSKVKSIREQHDLHQKEKGKTAEGASELKTDGDIASHKIMFYTLKRNFPDIKILSEEHEEMTVHDHELPALSVDLPELNNLIESPDDLVPSSEVTIWIDPLDATQEYTEDLRQYVTTMVCVAVKGQPVLGIIHRVFDQTTEWAYVGKAKSPGLAAPKTDSDQSNLKIIVSRSHQGQVEAVAKKSFGENTQVIPAGGAGYKSLEVIAGRADAYVHVTAIKKWDICAGDALVRAVGGNQTTLTNKTIDYSDSAHALNPDGLLLTLRNHNEFLTKLRPVFLDLKSN